MNKLLLKLGGGLDFEKLPLPTGSPILSMEKVLGYDPGQPAGTDLDRSDLVIKGIYQDGSQVCVAVDMFQQLAMRSKFLQVVVDKPIRRCRISIGAHYWLAKARGAGIVSKGKDWRPFDTGCRLSDAWAAASEVGLISESQLPFDPRKVCDRPTSTDFQSGGSHDWLNFSYLPAHQEQIRSAVQNGFGVGLPLPVDEWLTEWKASDGAWYLKGPIEGYHMVTVCGCVAEGMLFHTGWRHWNGGNQIGLVDWSMLRQNDVGAPVMLRAADKFLSKWTG